MKLPVIQGIIRRRILANFRVEPQVMQRQLLPKNSIEFDHALIMKNVAHEWHSAEDLYV